MNNVRRGVAILVAVIALGTCKLPGTAITVPNGDFALPPMGPSTVFAYSAEHWTLQGDCGRSPYAGIVAFVNVTSVGPRTA